MRTTRKISRGVFCVLLTLFSLGALLLLWPHESLMRQATRIAGWQPRQEAAWQNDDSYWWLSDHEILFLSIQRASENLGDYTAVRYDTRTGIQTDLTALEQTLFAHRCNMHTSAWQVSPDGKYLLWNGSDTIAGTDPATQQPALLLKERWYVTSLDGKQTQTWPRVTSDHPCAFWLSDSHQWVEWHDHYSNNGAQLRMEIHTIGKDAVTFLNSALDPRSYMPIGLTGPENGLCVSPRVGDGDVTLVRWAMTPGFVSHSGTFLPTPGKTGPIEAIVSPQGDRIAWKFGATPGPRFLSGTRFMRHLHPSEAGLYVSRSDGSDMRLLGAFHTPPDELIHLRWTPDGRRLSFACRGSLYTVPAP